MKKKVLVFSHALEIGGAERALLGLLESFDYSRYEVDLFLMRHEGELFQYIPETAHLLPPIKQYTGLAVPLVSLIKNGNIGVMDYYRMQNIQADTEMKKGIGTGATTFAENKKQDK